MSADPELQAFFAQCDAMLLRLRRPAWNGVVFFWLPLAFGAGWVKALAVGFLVSLLCFVGYGNRWIERLGFLGIAAAILVWLGVLPPVNEWQNGATLLLHQLKQISAS